jgi:hypothetical protein
MRKKLFTKRSWQVSVTTMEETTELTFDWSAESEALGLPSQDPCSSSEAAYMLRYCCELVCPLMHIGQREE